MRQITGILPRLINPNKLIGKEITIVVGKIISAKKLPDGYIEYVADITHEGFNEIINRTELKSFSIGVK